MSEALILQAQDAAAFIADRSIQFAGTSRANGIVAINIKYIGAQDSGTVEVAAGGDITLKHGALGSEVVDTTVGVPTLNGILDVSDAGMNTFLEMVNHIRASNGGDPNWEINTVDVPLTYVTTNTLATLAATQAKVVDGVYAVIDYAEADNLTAASTFNYPVSIGTEIAANSSKMVEKQSDPINIEGLWRKLNKILSFNTQVTAGSDAATAMLVSILAEDKSGVLRTLLMPISTAAAAVLFNPNPAIARQGEIGEKLFLLLTTVTVPSIMAVNIQGRSIRRVAVGYDAP